MSQTTLDALFAEWAAARDRGVEVPVEVLCRDHPELAPALRARIAALTTAAHAPDHTADSGTRPAAPPARLGGYRIERVLGEGGMGTVYLATDEVLGRAVAVKTMRPALAATPGAAERFLREARAVAAIDHDHVIQIYAVGREGDVPYFVMPLLEGESLDARLRREGALPADEAVRIGREVAAGLAAAHARGLIHRDVKPANVWLSEPGGRVKLLDFGLARPADPDAGLTAAGEVLGTPAYMAPEQAGGRKVDPRADLFGLGCVLYHAATGERPFAGPTAAAVLVAVATAVPPPARSLNPAVPAALSDLIDRLLAKNPDRRPATAGAVAVALARVATGQPADRADVPHGGESLTPPPSVPSSTAPTGARPRRRRAAAAAVLLGVAAIGVFVGTKVWRPAERPNADPPVGGIPTTPEPVVVGVLHSQGGTMAVSENPVVDATLLAIEEVNAAGGVLGRPLKAVVADGKSDPEEFAKQAERLLTGEKAAVVFGCWTSASRKAVRPAVERNAGLLFYPARHEGLEESPRIVYLGPTPNQQLIPAVDYAIDTLKKRRVALVGSDHIYSRTAHAIARDRLAERRKAGADVEVVAEVLLPLGAFDARPAANAVRDTTADVVLNTLDGTTNGAFFRDLRHPKEGAPTVTTLSVGISEHEVRGLNPRALTDDYLVAGYLQAVDRAEGREFVRKVRAKYGAERAATDTMVAAYGGVYLWATAATAAKTVDPGAVLAAVRGLEFDGPGARVKIDAENLHAWLPVRIGRVRPDGEVVVVAGAGSTTPVRPVPYPPTRTPAEWDQFLQTWYLQWGGKWQGPGK